MRRKRAYELYSVAVLYRNDRRIIKREASAFYIQILCIRHYRTVARVVDTFFYKKYAYILSSIIPVDLSNINSKNRSFN